VVGPTAIGKTALAIRLAQAFNTEIISADSRQFYKEMRIGTAVPSEEELATVPHHFIHIKSIFDSYTVGDFEREALAKLDKLFKHHDTIVLAGGSGLYIDAVVNGLDDFPEVASEIREQLHLDFSVKGIEMLQNELQKIDPQSYRTIDIQNKHRLLRAIEIHRATGKPFSSFLNKKLAPRTFNTLYIGLTANRETIYDRINRRVELMLSAGLIEEAKQLYAHKSLNALQTVGYKELFEWFDGKISKEVAISEIKKNTRRFAKRQGTWFKRNEVIHWFDISEDASEIITHTNLIIKGG